MSQVLIPVTANAVFGSSNTGIAGSNSARHMILMSVLVCSFWKSEILTTHERNLQLALVQKIFSCACIAEFIIIIIIIVIIPRFLAANVPLFAAP
jgi:hypothetical protein